MFGPAQYGVASAVVDSVHDDMIPLAEADDVFVCVDVFINWEAKDQQKIQNWNYQGTKLAIRRAVTNMPTAEQVLELEHRLRHPFAANPMTEDKEVEDVMSAAA